MSKESPAQLPWLAGKRVIIAGGGIAGLSFSRALDRYWPQQCPKPEVVLYERSTEQGNGWEGYSISIRSDGASGGMQALQKLGLLDDMLKASHTGFEGKGSMNFWDRNWNKLLALPRPATPPDGLPVNSMRIARNVLRRQLINGVPSSTKVNWGVACQSAALLPDGRVEVTLSDGSSDRCDLLVAADGSGSKMRSTLLPNDILTFAGAVCITGRAVLPRGLPKIIEHNWGLAFGGDGNALFVSPIDDTSAIWSISYRAQKARDQIRNEEAVKLQQQLINEARERGKGFADPFGQLLDATEPSTLMVLNAMDKQPLKHSELMGARVVFIGDANHAVSPFAGNGSNMALMDGIDLATTLSSATSIAEAISDFEKRTTPRSKKSVGQSHFAIRVAHTSGWRYFLWSLALRVINFFLKS